MTRDTTFWCCWEGRWSRISCLLWLRWHVLIANHGDRWDGLKLVILEAQR